MFKYFQAIIEQLSQRTAEATLSILGISHPQLRQFLADKFNQPTGSATNILNVKWKEDSAALMVGKKTAHPYLAKTQFKYVGLYGQLFTAKLHSF